MGDLEDGTFIAVFSCYRDPALTTNLRKLVVESKEPGRTKFEIPLTHNSIVVWSTETNRLFKHKIVLDGKGRALDNQCLGITFRTSKASVQAHDDGTCFEDGRPLALADEEQSRENVYPQLLYTVSKSDQLSPKFTH